MTETNRSLDLGLAKRGEPAEDAPVVVLCLGAPLGTGHPLCQLPALSRAEQREVREISHLRPGASGRLGEQAAALREALRAGGTRRVEGELAGAHLQMWSVLLGRRARVLVNVVPPAVLLSGLEGTRREVAAARYERDLRSVLGGCHDMGVELLVHLPDAPLGLPEVGGSPHANEELLDELVELARGLAGRHDRLPGIELPPPSGFATALIELSAQLDRALEGVEFLSRELESVLRVEPELPVLDCGFAGASRDEEAMDPSGSGPYPLDAAQDRVAFHRWLQGRREPVVLPSGPLPKRASTRPVRGARPLVSILVPVYRTPLWALERCVASVLGQSRGDWELCLVDDGSNSTELTAALERIRRIDRRIRVSALAASGGISAATNAAAGLATGSFLAFLDHDDELSPDALERVAAAIGREPEGDLFYSDEDKIDERGERFDPLFKPEWSPDLLLSFAYTCHLTVIRRELFDDLGGLRSEFDGSQDYDLAIRAGERARRVVHIPELLYHWRSLPSSAASGSAAKPWAYEAGRLAIADALARRGEAGEVTEHPRFPGRYHVRRAIPGTPLVSVIIPFRDEPALLATAVSTLREHAGWDRIEFVLVDNGSELPETKALLAELAHDDDVRICEEPGPFNWAAINNSAARAASGDYLVFMNNDIEAREPGWMSALLSHAQRREVGAVGARLLYPDGTIQHAGVVIGLGGIAGHVLRGLDAERPGYNSTAIVTRNCSVVTGACMMVRREVFFEVGGFDEQLPVAFNDVDFCLKLRERGYLIVFTPLAELIHHESKSRGHTDDLDENKYIRDRWGDALNAGDPYMNEHLSHWRYWCPLSTPQEDYRWKVYLETPVPQPGSSSST
jgi:O-antigen biosynthesis protein